MTTPPTATSQPTAATTTRSSATYEKLKKSVNEFGFELFKVFMSRHKQQHRNLCFSPLAVYDSLLMSRIGSKNITEKQLSKMLHINDIAGAVIDESVLNEWQDLRQTMIKNNHDILMFSNFLYVDDSVQLKDKYLNQLKKYFNTKPKKVTFSNVKETVKTINADSQENTDGVIDGLIIAKDISEDNKNVRLILATSLFFRGFWAQCFDQIEKKEFVIPNNGQSIKINLQMIGQLGQFRYMHSRQLDADIVSIPYVTSDLRMVVILPRDVNSDGHSIIEYLNRDIFATIMDTLQTREKTEVNVWIPRFALNAQKVSLQRTIKQMGAIDLFEESLADLGDMCDQKKIHLTKLVHKTFILVDERGATHSTFKVNHNNNHNNNHKSKTSSTNKTDPNNIIKKSIEDPNCVLFKANHPFVFIITDKTTKVALLMVYFGDAREMLEVILESELTEDQITKLLSEVSNNH
ncbi:serpin B3-like [Oppia nitens]|uniref:serpin B3-like n=1 Tax=Oppia nitens TaxID=1686743 RepID=UPI0023DC1433|nr:serpin B3-like [Oppia nitens]